MTEAGIEVLAGGQPCQPFSKAGRAGIRHLVEKGERDPEDEHRHLGRAYLEGDPRVSLGVRPRCRGGVL